MFDDLEKAPGFRRRFRIHPHADQVTAAVEDDYHCMAVALRHDGVRVTGVDPAMDRAPWTTCPGARARLRATFEGATLAEIAARGEKQFNCTHLYDLALLAAAHAFDTNPVQFDLLVSDPADGLVRAEIRRDGAPLLRLSHRDDVIESPEEIAGLSLLKLRPWIDRQERPLREAARLLQWGALIAHGRSIPMERQSDARKMPPNCYTFQPETAGEARRVGKIIDFSRTGAEPLDHFDGVRFRDRAGA